ncbi:hypothetical protein ACQPZ2_02075 [Nocardia pseudovaccinii]|uniref:hypothetical protein n=1 Tax=Nocardia pseudovaccinii TaxID=189540 RepID=UPI003D8AE8AC
MNTPTALDPDGAHLHNCLTDPGVLTDNDAIRAISIHHSCPPQCLVLGRALDTLGTKYTSIPGPCRQSSVVEPRQRSATPPLRSEEFSELDHHLADQLRKLQNLQAHIEETK